MYIHSVKLKNFKSIGDYPEAEIIIEPRITAIIGKNESGKSNVLDGLSRINFREKKQSAFSSDIINRNKPFGTENSYTIVLKPAKEDIQKGLIEETQIEISKNGCKVSGGFLSYYQKAFFQDFEAVVSFLESISGNPLQVKEQELKSYKKCIQEMKQKEQLDLHCRTSSLEFLRTRTSKLSVEYRGKFQEILNIALDTWSMLLYMFPRFFYRKSDKHLNAQYKIEEVEKELKGPTAAPNSLLYNFVKLIGVSLEEFTEAVRPGSIATQESLRRRINRLVDKKINDSFSEFYQTEKIKLDLSFNTGVVSFAVRSDDGEALLLSERSNGLKWYLETFIDAQANGMNKGQVVYLLDEPGISLHVNAQRELLRLFQHLAEKGNQIVYTTHSPYMLDLEGEGIHRIRAVVKNEEGYSYIYKTAYDPRISPESQQDTLAPIINAIGMNLNDTIGPSNGKINIVTEGISDYIFLSTMAKILDVDTEKYAIIPSVGATNCVNICAILHGWGCKYLALFDYDKKGVESGGEYLRKKMLFEYKRQYCYVREVDQAEIEQKTYNDSPFMIEDIVTREEINKFCVDKNISKSLSKALVAKEMGNAIEAGSYKIGNICKDNFNALFERIFSYFTE